MTELSTAAQAVLDAYEKSNDCYRKEWGQLAAALRAAVDEVISSIPPPCEDFDEYAQGFLSAHVKYRQQLLVIVDELKAS